MPRRATSWAKLSRVRRSTYVGAVQREKGEPRWGIYESQGHKNCMVVKVTQKMTSEHLGQNIWSGGPAKTLQRGKNNCESRIYPVVWAYTKIASENNITDHRRKLLYILSHSTWRRLQGCTEDKMQIVKLPAGTHFLCCQEKQVTMLNVFSCHCGSGVHPEPERLPAPPTTSSGFEEC